MTLKIIRKNGKKIIFNHVDSWEIKDGKYVVLQYGNYDSVLIKKGDKVE